MSCKELTRLGKKKNDPCLRTKYRECAETDCHEITGSNSGYCELHKVTCTRCGKRKPKNKSATCADCRKLLPSLRHETK